MQLYLGIGPLNRSLRFNEAIKVEPLSNLNGVLIRRDTRDAHAQRKGLGRTQQEGIWPQEKKPNLPPL